MGLLDGDIRLVLLDVGGVLIHLRPWAEVLEPLGIRSAAEVRQALEPLEASETARRFQRGEVRPEEFIADVRHALSIDWSDRAIRERYLQRLGPPMERMEDLIRELRARGLRVAALSNTCPIHVDALRRYPFAALIERLIASCEIGRAKPSRAAYEEAVHILEVEPEQALLIDDLSENIQGAREAGLGAVLFEGPANLRQALGLPPSA